MAYSTFMELAIVALVGKILAVILAIPFVIGLLIGIFIGRATARIQETFEDHGETGAADSGAPPARRARFRQRR
jgi:hypothetical protein